MVELLIATGVLSLFLGGLFSLYRMGSGMFQAGSWRLQKQKEAERFLAVLKERLERASHAVEIDPPRELRQAETHVGFIPGTICRAAIGAGTFRVLRFVVGKPSVAPTSPGLLVYHAIRAAPSNEGPDLMNVELVSSTNQNHAAFVGTPFSVFPAGLPTLARFNQPGALTPQGLRLGADGGRHEITGVASLTMEHRPGAGPASPSLLSVSLEFRHSNRRFADAWVRQQTVARVEVPVTSRALGEL